MNNLKSKLTFCLIVVFVLGIAAGLISVPGKAAPPEPKANWNPCYRDFGFPYECTTVMEASSTRSIRPIL